MSLLLVVLALLLVGAVALLALGRVPARLRDRAAVMLHPADGTEILAVPVANHPPVLLDADAGGERLAEQVDGVRFALGLRGYRMEQVDEVLDVLRDALVERDARITDLEQRLDESERTPATSSSLAPERRAP